ncbi:MAG TPA: type II toxin-antitoxin system Phd/YefM family antitoxin [Chthoniobacterales bacterium]|jgi:prevent-host-death family protein|nr:type II toxin-antitoxin system Phd/YefM family antitoxin [Chthoniobacterales bacterium]
MDKVISVAEARQNLSDVLGQVAFRHQSFIVTKKGKPVARIVPVEPSERPWPRTLADVDGWLDSDDHFFQDLRQARRSAGPVRSAFARKPRT